MGGIARTSTHLLQLNTNLGAPSISRFSRNGWDRTNLNSPPPTQHKPACPIHFALFAEWVGSHEPQPTSSNSTQTWVPHPFRVFRGMGGIARTSTHLLQLNTNPRAPSISRFSRNGWDRTNLNSPPPTQHKPACPIHFALFAEWVGSHEPQPTSSNSTQTWVPHPFRVFRGMGGIARTSTHLLQLNTNPRAPSISRFSRNGWDRTNLNPPPPTQHKPGCPIHFAFFAEMGGIARTSTHLLQLNTNPGAPSIPRFSRKWVGYQSASSRPLLATPRRYHLHAGFSRRNPRSKFKERA